MATGWSRSRCLNHICLILLLYLVFDGQLYQNWRYKAKFSDINVLHASKAASAPKFDVVLNSNRVNRRKTNMVSSKQALMSVCSLARKSTMALLLIYLANDVELNPGPDAFSSNLQSSMRSRGLKVCHINIRSIKATGKLDLLKLFLEEKPIDVLTVSEIWLKPSISDSEVFINGYSCVRRDRLNKGGGGIMIYIRDGIPYRF